eukprot:940260-Pyramimonas_sp.AAC.1
MPTTMISYQSIVITVASDDPGTRHRGDARYHKEDVYYAPIAPHCNDDYTIDIGNHGLYIAVFHSDMAKEVLAEQQQDL